MQSARSSFISLCTPEWQLGERARAGRGERESTQSVLNFDYSSPHTLNSFVCAPAPAPLHPTMSFLSLRESPSLFLLLQPGRK